MKKFLLDNKEHKLADYLNEHLQECKDFRLVSAYFSIYGYAALRDELNTPQETKFLLGEPESADSAAGPDRPDLLATLGENGLSFAPSHFWQQQFLARQCAEWIRKDSVLVRSMVQSNFLHGKMYHMQKDAERSAATVGSSNFTSRGLGKSTKSNLEINIAIEDKESRDELALWFDELWNNKKQVKDVKKDLLDALEHYCKDYAPEFVYYKTLFEIFRDEIDKRKSMEELSAGGVSYKDTKIWKALYEFQQDAVGGIISRLREHNGCILADSVGLGKTYTALAVIKYFQMRGDRILVLCPKKLEDNWRVYKASTYNSGHPLEEDKFSYALLSHTDLSRDSGNVGDINLAKFNREREWGEFDLVVIDESHNFRNDTKGQRGQKSRYEKLMKNVTQDGRKTKVLMLSATPVNNSLIDLRNQINIMTAGYEGAFRDSLHISNTKTLFTNAQKKFKQWEEQNKNKKEKNRTQLLEFLGGDFMRLLGGVTIARSRQQIKRVYKSFIDEQGDFPNRVVGNEYPTTDTEGELKYENLNDKLKSVQFFIYRPSRYIDNPSVQGQLDAEREKYHYNQEDRERFLVEMMRINFMKRLESSAHALKLTLGRVIGKIDKQIGRINDYLETQKDEKTNLVGKDEEDLQDEDEDFVVNSKALQPFYLKDMRAEDWRKELLQDREILQEAFDDVEKITPERDNKLQTLKEQLRKKAKQKKKKMLVFTAFTDTAKYLYDNIEECAKECNISVAMISGTGTLPQKGASAFLDILNNFSPLTRGQETDDEIDLLIATDCVSEGQNLQDCDMVLNYDIHWNPVRLIQRFGRIDRIGSQNKTVQMLNFWPTENMEYYLKLESRVKARMALVDATTTLENSLEDEIREAAQGELNFRDELMRKMCNKEAIDLEDANSVNMSDFTLDHFLMQLLRYLRKNQKDLEKELFGIHAVVNAADSKLSQPGAVFVFRHKNPPERGNNPIHPFYVVHVGKDRVYAGFMQARNVLSLLMDLAEGKKEPLKKLCRAFDSVIKTKEGEAFYKEMAQRAVENILETDKEEKIRSLQTSRDGLLAKKEEKPNNDNLQLLTWFAIREE